MASGVDYSTFVQLPEPGLTVENGGWRQLCVEGVAAWHALYRDLPRRAAGGRWPDPGQIGRRSRNTSATASPGVRFPGRAYVLPNTGDAALPVETVNTEKLDLTLFRVTDRNLLRAIQDDYFGAPMQAYSEEYFRRRRWARSSGPARPRSRRR